MTSVDEAVGLLAASVTPLAGVAVATTSAVGRVLTAPVLAPEPLPRFDQSAMDGYAVAHDDVAAVPAVLAVSTSIAARGHDAVPVLEAGTAARIFTGGVVPSGADTVVRQESTTPLAGGHVRFDVAVAPGTDVRRRGEEVRVGDRLADPGTELTAGLVGSLVAAGVAEVEVATAPRVRVLVTGDEIVAAGVPVGIGQVPDSNGPLVEWTLRRWGVEPRAVGRVADEEAGLESGLREAAEDADLVITTGGVSVGDFDLVPPVAERIGFERVFWKVSQRPGGPLYAARRRGTLLIGLPGNPAAVFVNMHVYVRLALDGLRGVDHSRRWRVGLCVDPPRAPEGRTAWVRCVSGTAPDGTLRLEPLGHQASHMLSNLADADSIARVDPGAARDRGNVLVPWIQVVH